MAYICEAQKKLLVQFLNEHPELKSGKFTKDFTHKKGQILWQQVTNLLNSVPNGAVKQWPKWRKTWQDMKKNAKAKNALLNRYSRGTGGGPSKVLSELDSEIIGMLNIKQTEGMDVEETPIEFSYSPIMHVNAEIKENLAPDSSSVSEYETDCQVGAFKDIFNKTDDILAQSSRSTPEQPQVSENEDHNYNLNFPTTSRQAPKRVTKTTRLQSSLKLTQNYLKAMNERNMILENHYKRESYNEFRKIRINLNIAKRNNVWWRYLKM